MKTGLFFGSFNPVHIGHLALANYIVENTDIKQLWFVVSPHNPLKKKDTLLADHLRLEMLELAVGDDNKYKVSNIEFRMPKPSFTIDTLTYLSEKYPNNEFVILMGADGLETFSKWKNFEQIIAKYQRYIYPRLTDQIIDFKAHQNIVYLNEAPIIEISSSFIRQSIKEGKDMRYFMHEKVFDFVDKMNLYKK
jgi:nicotinate-nucleotide adenylyltransferase